MVTRLQEVRLFGRDGVSLGVREFGTGTFRSARAWGLQARLQRESALLFYGQAQTSYPLVSLLGGAPTTLPPCSPRVATGDDVPGITCYL